MQQLKLCLMQKPQPQPQPQPQLQLQRQRQKKWLKDHHLARRRRSQKPSPPTKIVSGSAYKKTRYVKASANAHAYTFLYFLLDFIFSLLQLVTYAVRVIMHVLPIIGLIANGYFLAKIGIKYQQSKQAHSKVVAEFLTLRSVFN